MARNTNPIMAHLCGGPRDGDEVPITNDQPTLTVYICNGEIAWIGSDAPPQASFDDVQEFVYRRVGMTVGGHADYWIEGLRE